MDEQLSETHPFLALTRYRFSFEVTTLTILPPYKGAIFRGAVGNAFRKTVCPVPRGECSRCLLGHQCLYVTLFEPQPPADYPHAGKFSQAPPPYVLNPPLTNRQAFHPGDPMEFELVLIGRASEALPYFIYAFMEIGRRGLGIERGKYRILQVDQLRSKTPTIVYDGHTQTLRPCLGPQEEDASRFEDSRAQNITLRFLTPLRLKEKGKLVTELSFPLFYQRLKQRIALLSAFYGMNNNLHNSYRDESVAQEVQVTADSLHWYDWERYSGRQKETMRLGGLKGEITFCGDFGPLMPALRLGEQINVGQSTTFGLGRYEIIQGMESTSIQ